MVPIKRTIATSRIQTLRTEINRYACIVISIPTDINKMQLLLLRAIIRVPLLPRAWHWIMFSSLFKRLRNATSSRPFKTFRRSGSSSLAQKVIKKLWFKLSKCTEKVAFSLFQEDVDVVFLFHGAVLLVFGAVGLFHGAVETSVPTSSLIQDGISVLKRSPWRRPVFERFRSQLKVDSFLEVFQPIKRVHACGNRIVFFAARHSYLSTCSKTFERLWDFYQIVQKGRGGGMKCAKGTKKKKNTSPH